MQVIQYQYHFHITCKRQFCFLGQLFDRVDLIKSVSDVCPYVCTCTCMSVVRPSTKRFFDFNEIWHVCRGRWVMHDGVQYDPIQGQGQEPFKVGNPAIFNSYPPPFTMGAGNWPRILKLRNNILIWSGRIFEIWPSFCVTWLWSWQKCQLWRVNHQSHTGLIFYIQQIYKYARG